MSTRKELEIDPKEMDFTDLFENDKQPLMNEGLIGLHEQQNKEAEVEPEPRHFIVKRMQQEFLCIEKGLSTFEDMDPNAQLLSKTMEACHKAFSPYNVILEEKQTIQGTLNWILKCIE